MTSRDDVIRIENLPPEVLKPAGPRYQLPIDLSRPLAEQLAEFTAAFEERYLRRALKRTRAHIGRTARITGLSRRTITEKLALYRHRQERVQERLSPSTDEWFGTTGVPGGQRMDFGQARASRERKPTIWRRVC